MSIDIYEKDDTIFIDGQPTKCPAMIINTEHDDVFYYGETNDVDERFRSACESDEPPYEITLLAFDSSSIESPTNEEVVYIFKRAINHKDRRFIGHLSTNYCEDNFRDWLKQEMRNVPIS